MNEDASQLKNSRYKVHKVSLEFLPSEFQDRTAIFCQQGLAVITGVVWPSYTSCVVNPVNQTYRVPPVLGSDWQPVSLVCVEENGEGEFSFRAYADETSEEADEYESPGWYWSVYSSDNNEWEDMAMCIKTERTLQEPAVSMVKDAFCIAHGWGVVYMGMYDQKSGELVHSFPPWQQQAVVQVNFLVQDEQVVALASSTTAENVCEMWKVDATSSSSSAWMRVGAMPHGVLWPLDDVHFFSVRSVEVVGTVAFIAVLGLDRPVHTWEEYDDWIGDCPSYPTHGFLVAFDFVQASWKLVCV